MHELYDALSYNKSSYFMNQCLASINEAYENDLPKLMPSPS